MTVHKFKINSYTVTLADKLDANYGGRSIKARGVVACIGPDNNQIVGYFLGDDSPIPNPITTDGDCWGIVFLPMNVMSLWIDILRNEGPIYGYINTDYPEWTHISTSAE